MSIPPALNSDVGTGCTRRKATSLGEFCNVLPCHLITSRHAPFDGTPSRSSGQPVKATHMHPRTKSAKYSPISQARASEDEWLWWNSMMRAFFSTATAKACSKKGLTSWHRREAVFDGSFNSLWTHSTHWTQISLILDSTKGECSKNRQCLLQQRSCHGLY